MNGEALYPKHVALAERLERQHNALISVGRYWRRYEHDVDKAIRAINETAARALAIERVSVWFFDDERTQLTCRDLYVAEHDKHTTATSLSAGDYPAYFAALKEGEVIDAADVHNDPRTREFIDAYFEPHGIGATLDAPIRSGGSVVGVLCHEHVGGTRTFHPDEISTAMSLASMLSAAIEFQSRRESEQAAQRSLALLRAAFEASGVGIVATDQDGAITAHNKAYLEMWGMPGSLLAPGSDVEARLAHHIEAAADPDQLILNYERFKYDPDYEFVEKMPLKDGRTFEVTTLPQKLDGKVIGRVWSFADITDSIKAEQELRRLSYYDDLTGLCNRRRIEQALEQEMYRSKRSGCPLSVAVVDIDNFKAVNDTYGHAVGDAVLRELTADMQGRMRKTDIIGRWGGEEFLLLLYDTPLEGAVKVLDELRATVARERDDVPVFTVSAGVTRFQDGQTLDQVVKAADDKLYDAKNAGRNRVAA